MSDEPISITDPNLQKLYDYWLQKRGARLAPQRADIDPADLKFILSYIYSLDVLGPPYRFRFRVAGTEITKEYGEEITGKFADEVDFDRAGDLILGEYESVARDGRPLVNRVQFTKRDGRDLDCEHLILPLSMDGKKIDILFGAAIVKGVGPIKK
jgi:hypothetical protein